MTTKKKRSSGSTSAGTKKPAKKISTSKSATKPASRPANRQANDAASGQAKAGGAAARTGKTGRHKPVASDAEPRSAKAGGSSRPRATVDGGVVTVEREIGGRMLRLETGRMARQADGAIVATYGDTVVLATAQSAKARDDIDFFPLTVDYREKYAAGGRFPGGFFKREGRPTTREILTCRIIDRSIRPLFPDGFRNEVQVLSQVLSSDLQTESDILAAVASFASVAISSIPSERTLGCVRIGLVDDKLLVNPTWSVLQSPECRLNLTLAAHADAIVMVEAGAQEVSEDVMLEALALGHRVCQQISEMIDELRDRVGRQKQPWTAPQRDAALDREIDKRFGKQLRAAAVASGDKHDRSAAQKAALEEVRSHFVANPSLGEKERKRYEAYVAEAAKGLIKEGERDSVLAGRRADGRDHKTIRPITIEVGVLPRVHGSVLFTRGETQALCIATLGTADDTQNRDGIYPEDPQRFMLHYSFPPFSVGEVRRMVGPGRREIGHGSLAERSIAPLMPPIERFPYTCRITSEILESNGSSSMASVCGGTLALMDAGVPIQQPVAGIAMGLVMQGKKYAILSDILGSEDHCGDMDFKVAGTGRGLTALQMDIKCEGLTGEILEQALEQAREGRLHILRTMLKALRKPRTEISPNAPRLITVQVPVDKIGAIIGPGGSHIRGLQAEHNVRISIDDSGFVTIAGVEASKAEACAEYIRSMTQEVEVGKVYEGRITSIKEFGAFVEILPGQEGLCHVSELSNRFIRSVTDEVKIGDEVKVKVIGIDDFGKIRLSRRALMEPVEDDRPRRQNADRDQEDADEPIFRRGSGRAEERHGRGAGAERESEPAPRRAREPESVDREIDTEEEAVGAGDRAPRGEGRGPRGDGGGPREDDRRGRGRRRPGRQRD